MIDYSAPDEITSENMGFIDQVFESVSPKPIWVACRFGDIDGFALVISPPDQEELLGVTEGGQMIANHPSPMLVCLTVRAHDLHKIEFLSPEEFRRNQSKDG